MIRLSPNARLLGLRPELNLANLALLGILMKHGVTMILAHAIDGTHSRASLHYAGCAEDLVFAATLEKDQKLQIFNEWRESVGPEFDVLFEDQGTANEHLHCEYQPKTPY